MVARWQKMVAVDAGRKVRCACLALALIAAISGCSKRYSNLPAFSPLPVGDSVNQSVGRFKTSYLADQIHAYFRGSVSGPIAVTTFVDIDNLYQSSTFGRMVSEQLISELAMRGYNVLEIRLSDAMQIMDHRGEFGLSRDTRRLRGFQEISGLVVGTYTASPDRVYLNARVIDPSTATVISAGSVEMWRTREMSKLLRANSFPPSLERIPVRHLGYSVYPAPYYWPGPGYGWPLHPSDKEEWVAPVPPARQSAVPKPQLPPAVGGEALN